MKIRYGQKETASEIGRDGCLARVRSDRSMSCECLRVKGLMMMMKD